MAGRIGANAGHLEHGKVAGARRPQVLLLDEPLAPIRSPRRHLTEWMSAK